MNRNWLSFCWLATVLGGMMSLVGSDPRSVRADETARPPTVHFRNGDFASGQLLDSPVAGSLIWKSDAFVSPLELPLSGIRSIQFPATQPAADAGPYCFELAGDDTLHGALVSLDERQAVLEVPSFGTLHVERAALLRFYRTSAADLVFAGPGGLDGWKTTGPEKAWRDEAGHLQTNQEGAAIRRDIRLPALARYEIELAWSDRPNFELSIGLSENAADAPAFQLSAWGEDLVVSRETPQRAGVALVQKIMPGAGQVRLLALYDQPRGRLLVYSAAGEKIADFTVPDDHSAPPPRVTKAQPGLLLRAPTSKPQVPGGMQLVNRRGEIKLQRLTVSRWSGVAPLPAVAGQAMIHQLDGTIRSAEVRSFDAAAREFVLAKDGLEQRLAERQLLDVVLAQPGEVAPRAVRVLLASGARLSGDLTKIEGDRLTLKCPTIHEPLLLPVQDLQGVLMMKTEPPETTAEASPESRQVRLELRGVSLRGRLIDSRMEEHSCLVFHPQMSSVASPLAAGVSGRLVLSEPAPPPKIETSSPGTPSPALQIVNGMRTLLGVRQTPSLRPAPPGDCLLHLRSGDTLPCRVLFIDESGVSLKSTVTDATFVPHSRIKALELRLDARPVKIERTKVDRLLTLPRMQRDNPPEHLIRSLEGDYLRGRLLSMNDKALQVEMRLEPKTIDRAQVTRIIWLHPDEAAKATVASGDPPAVSEKLLAGTRVQAVPQGGNRLTFFAQQLSGKTLSGQSEVLGACRVELDKIDHLLVGDAIDEAAATLAFHRWKLRPAPEPLPDPEPGSAPDDSAGMESVLVGKAAPPIDLELLGANKRFRLEDYKNKIVVLDFWASWCGPCLQVMPQVDAVSREFAAEGVHLVAINLEETPERIKTALEKLNLETAVALDKDGRVAERYGATAIPQTVIIDREGKVARLFVGGGARFDEQLRQALNAVLAQPKADSPTQ